MTLCFFFRAESTPAVEVLHQGHAGFMAGLGPHADAQEPAPEIVLFVLRFLHRRLYPLCFAGRANQEGEKFHHGPVLYGVPLVGKAEGRRFFIQTDTLIAA